MVTDAPFIIGQMTVDDVTSFNPFKEGIKEDDAKLTTLNSIEFFKKI